MYLFPIIYLLFIHVFAILSFKLLGYENTFSRRPTAKNNLENLP